MDQDSQMIVRFRGVTMRVHDVQNPIMQEVYIRYTWKGDTCRVLRRDILDLLLKEMYDRLCLRFVECNVVEHENRDLERCEQNRKVFLRKIEQLGHH
jgi:hypothetical protein